ncbi:ABC transporter permease [Aestuariimicrobium ganziense]|uniref:ABC transporter permease n=1 Tax=Aestuariimicrobium ganziense TaxID=2773677 RepID=UPI0019451126|nr:FtsX-like permease family protein [Aestuariimicrobium ganziense]
MIRTLVRKSLAKHRLVSVLLAGFMVLAAALVTSALMLTVALIGSVDRFMEQAHTPHYLQMHTGPLDRARLEAFVRQHPEVVAHEDIALLNVENSTLSFNGTPLDGEMQQTGLAVQPTTMDFLLSEAGEVIRPQRGEIWVPQYYRDKYDLGVGQTVTVALPDGPLELTIAGAFRDSQMNSALASSKRLLVSDDDYATVRSALGVEPEHLLSFRFTDPGQAGPFEAAWHAAGLEANGPSLNWSMFRVVNSLNDAITAFLFTVMAFVIVLIAALCIRYTLLTTLEEDLGDIGVMRALGVRQRHVRSIYLTKYQVLLGAGSVVGFLLALVLRGPLLAGVRRQMGTVNAPVMGALAGAVGVLVLHLVVTGYVRRVMRNLRRIAPLEAMRGRSGLVTSRRRPRPVLGGRTGMAVVSRLALANIRRSRGQHLTLVVMAMLITVVLLVPFRFGSTFRSPDFVTHMGIGNYDLMVGLLNRDDALPVGSTIRATLADDPRVSRVEVFSLEVETVRTPDGRVAPLRIDYGDPAAFPLRHSQGRAPSTPSEISLSTLNAERLGVTVGDEILILDDGGEAPMTVVGTYQDITNGGKTSKAMVGPTTSSTPGSAMVTIALTPGADPGEVSRTIIDAVPGVQVLEATNFVSQMLGGLISVMDALAWLCSVVAVAIAALIAGLSVRLMQVQERAANALQTALGFTTAHLRRQYLVRVLATTVLGVVLGVVLAWPVGMVVAGAIFGTVGVSGVGLVFSPLTTVLGCLIVVASVALVTWSSTGRGSTRGLVDRLRT